MLRANTNTNNRSAAVYPVSCLPDKSLSAVLELSVELTWRARHARVAQIPERTCADRLMRFHAAKRVRCAWIRHGARIEALAVDAGIVRRAFRVIRAFRG